MMTVALPDGTYPFIDRRLPLADLQMIEAPPALETLLRRVAAENGTTIVSGEPVELTCTFQGVAEAAFLVWQPAEGARLHMLAPKDQAKGRA